MTAVYIIRLNSTTHPRYLVRHTCDNIVLWAMSKGAATEYASREEAQRIVDNHLQGLQCEILEIE